MEAQHFPVRDLLGRTAVDPEGRRLGRVTSVDCDLQEWRVAGVRVKLAREAVSRLHLEHLPFTDRTVEVPPRYVEVAGDYVLVTEPEEALRNEYLEEHRMEGDEGSPESV